MGCFVVLFALISPRLALFFILIFSDWVGQALDGWVVPVLGFFFLPWTLLAYIVMWQVKPDPPELVIEEQRVLGRRVGIAGRQSPVIH